MWRRAAQRILAAVRPPEHSQRATQLVKSRPARPPYRLQRRPGLLRPLVRHVQRHTRLHRDHRQALPDHIVHLRSDLQPLLVHPPMLILRAYPQVTRPSRPHYCAHDPHDADEQYEADRRRRHDVRTFGRPQHGCDERRRDHPAGDQRRSHLPPRRGGVHRDTRPEHDRPVRIADREIDGGDRRRDRQCRHRPQPPAPECHRGRHHERIRQRIQRMSRRHLPRRGLH
jgi:hypothetical protein